MVKTVFLSIPHSESFTAAGLTEKLRARGIAVMQVDDIESGSDIQASILSAIKRSDVVIALAGFNERNPNVLLEIGYAVGAGTPVILVSEGPPQIPFDIGALPVFVHRNLGPRVVDEIVRFINSLSPRKSGDQAIFRTAREHLAAAAENTGLLEQISPRQFEELVSQSLIELGFEVELVSGIMDAGIDIRLFIPNVEPVAVAVKKYTAQGRLGIGEVQRLVGACVVAGAQCAILLTTGGFTRAAYEFAEHAPMRLHLMTLGEFLLETKNSIIQRCTGAADSAISSG